MSSGKIQNLINLAKEAGVSLTSEQATALIAKYPGKQARTIVKVEFAAAVNAPKAKANTAEKTASSATKTKTSSAKAKTASTKAVSPKATPAKTTQAKTTSASKYKTLAEINAPKVRPEDYILKPTCEQDKYADMLDFKATRQQEDISTRTFRYYSAGLHEIYGSEDYKRVLKRTQEFRRDHLSPQEYFDDYTSDPTKLLHKKNCLVALRKMRSYFVALRLNGSTYLPSVENYSKSNRRDLGKKVFGEFKDLIEHGDNLDKWLKKEVKLVDSYQDILKDLTALASYFLTMITENQAVELIEESREVDLEMAAYTNWLYDLLLANKLFPEEQKTYPPKPRIPQGGWKKFKQRGHKLMFFLQELSVDDYRVQVLLAISSENGDVLHYTLFPADAQFEAYLDKLIKDLKLPSLDFCGFSAINSVFLAKQLEYLEKIGLEYFIRIEPINIFYPTAKEWAERVGTALYTQITPEQLQDRDGTFYVTAMALTRDEFDEHKFEVNKDASWLHTPVQDLTLAQTRPDLEAKADKPFCYLVAVRNETDQTVQEQWQEHLDLISSTDTSDLDEIYKLCNYLLLKPEKQGIVLSYDKVEKNMRSFMLSNVGTKCNIVQSKDGKRAIPALEHLAQMPVAFLSYELLELLQGDDFVWSLYKSQLNDTDLTSYDKARLLFPSYFYTKLALKNLLGEEAYNELMNGFATILGLG